ncbi:hypothetical protein V2J09_012850 [Rumex salicifolius]
MVKFSKQFEAQLIPEWKDAFVDYRKLKKELKKIHVLDTKQRTSSLSFIISSYLKKLSQLGNKHREHSPIQVHRKLTSMVSKGDVYETELLDQFTNVEAASEFFKLLDLQLNKVNQFYKGKEKEFLERGELLDKQIKFLIDLKTSLNQKHGKIDQSNESNRDISYHISCDDACIEKIEETEEEQCQEREGIQFTESSRKGEMERSNSKREENSSNGSSGRIFSYKGKNLTLNIPLTKPSHTFSAIVNLSNRYNPREAKVYFNKKEIHQAEKMLRGAFIELYKGNLNMLAFIKILKKFDKVTCKEVMPIYLRVVESSYFNTSDKVMKLADEVKELFVKHFAQDDHKKAMKYLKPKHREESHSVTFFVGLFAGCFLALILGYMIMAHIAGMYTQPSYTTYTETVIPVLSVSTLLFLHLFLYGCNIFMWRKTRINYSFIFELSPTKELKYREVFLICAVSMTTVVGVFFIHLLLVAKGYTSTQVQTLPGILVLFFLLLLVCPFNIVYKSSRYRFIRVIRNIAFTPLYKVVMLDFFMADQLCSQVPLLRNLEYIACYYITESYKTQDYNYCIRTTRHRDLAYVVSFLPYYWRAMQCARRWFDEGQTNHLVNLGKYVSAMLAAGAKLAYEKEESFGYLCLVVALSSAATVYQLYWDYVKDWGLLQFHSKNPWLRDELMVRQKFIYYISMALNFVLRLAWLQTVLHTNFGNIDYRVTGLFLAALEVIRRGQWNFYRLENEHLNNAGKFRAVKTIPLPFQEVDGEN